MTCLFRSSLVIGSSRAEALYDYVAGKTLQKNISPTVYSLQQKRTILASSQNFHIIHMFGTFIGFKAMHVTLSVLLMTKRGTAMVY